jgi:hypothetical protein
MFDDEWRFKTFSTHHLPLIWHLLETKIKCLKTSWEIFLDITLLLVSLMFVFLWKIVIYFLFYVLRSHKTNNIKNLETTKFKTLFLNCISFGIMYCDALSCVFFWLLDMYSMCSCSKTISLLYKDVIQFGRVQMFA